MFDADEATETPEAPPFDPATFHRVARCWRPPGPRPRRTNSSPICSGRRLSEPLLRPAHEEAGRARRLAIPHRPGQRTPGPDARALRAGDPRSRPRSRASLLERNRYSQAWGFFRMLGEPEPIREALEAYDPGPDDDVYPVIEIAWQGGVLPRKGFDLVLDRHGVCSAITMVSSSDLSANAELRDYCVGRLVRAVHEQLCERLRGDLDGAEGRRCRRDASISADRRGAPGTICRGRVPHRHVAPVERGADEHASARRARRTSSAQELCSTAARLAPGLQGHNEAPFEEGYDDYLAFLKVIAGAVRPPSPGTRRMSMRGSLGSGEGQARGGRGEQLRGAGVRELAAKANRPAEALAAAKEFLMAEDERNLICPGVNELAKKAGDFAAMAEAAKSPATTQWVSSRDSSRGGSRSGQGIA